MDKFKVILISLMAIICIFIIGFKYKKEAKRLGIL